jgi:hypothetical protein
MGTQINLVTVRKLYIQVPEDIVIVRKMYIQIPEDIVILNLFVYLFMFYPCFVLAFHYRNS